MVLTRKKTENQDQGSDGTKSSLKMLSSICCILASTDGEIEPSSLASSTVSMPSKDSVLKTQSSNPTCDIKKEENNLDAASFQHLLTTKSEFKTQNANAIDEAISSVVGPFKQISSLSSNFYYSSPQVTKRFRGGPSKKALASVHSLSSYVEPKAGGQRVFPEHSSLVSHMNSTHYSASLSSFEAPGHQSSGLFPPARGSPPKLAGAAQAQAQAQAYAHAHHAPLPSAAAAAAAYAPPPPAPGGYPSSPPGDRRPPPAPPAAGRSMNVLTGGIAALMPPPPLPPAPAAAGGRRGEGRSLLACPPPAPPAHHPGLGARRAPAPALPAGLAAPGGGGGGGGGALPAPAGALCGGADLLLGGCPCRPTFGLPGTQAVRCEDHTTPGMVHLTGRLPTPLVTGGSASSAFSSLGTPGGAPLGGGGGLRGGGGGGGAGASPLASPSPLRRTPTPPGGGGPRAAPTASPANGPTSQGAAGAAAAAAAARKLPWTKEEDARLTELVAQFGARKWNKIAPHLPGRNGKQCRERWVNQLNPELVKTAWSAEEDRRIIEAQLTSGNAWAGVARALPGRTDNAVKNRWHSSIKNKLEQFVALHYGRRRFRQLWAEAPGCRRALLDRAVAFVRDRRRAKRRQAFEEAAQAAAAERRRQRLLLLQTPGVDLGQALRRELEAELAAEEAQGAAAAAGAPSAGAAGGGGGPTPLAPAPVAATPPRPPASIMMHTAKRQKIL